MKTLCNFLVLLFMLLCGLQLKAQTQPDSSHGIGDSVQHIDSPVQLKKSTPTLDSFLKKNKYLNIATAPVSFAIEEKTRTGKEVLFYLLAITILLLALFKVFYSKYFNNIFRAFFNTSLRQNQLTDLLLQAKLPSLIFNIFFVISFGLYLWLIVNNYSPASDNKYLLAGFSILFVALVYIGKFISLKFIGWASGTSDAADQYIFIIFLINKITGILLIPFVVLLAFAPANWLNIILIASFCMIGIFFLLRYLRSYGLLQNQLKFNRFHFLLYIAAVEVLPVLVIYKLFNQFSYSLTGGYSSLSNHL